MAGTEYETPFCPWHTVAVPLMVPAAAGNGFTVIVIGFDVAVAGEAHDKDDVISQVTTSPFAKAEFV